MPCANAIDAAIGMMDTAYFTSRKDILDWINNLLCLSLVKVEQTASGAVACQLMDYIFPGSVSLHKVKWDAKEYEFVQNYKLLQTAFNKKNVQRHVDVDKIVRGKYQDNLEFMQWFKAFHDQQCGAESTVREGYDPVSLRAKGKGGKAAKAHFEKIAKEGSTKLLPGDRPEGMNRSGVDSRKFEDRVVPTGKARKNSNSNSNSNNDSVVEGDLENTDVAEAAADLANKRAQKRQALQERTDRQTASNNNKKNVVVQRSGSAPFNKSRSTNNIVQSSEKYNLLASKHAELRVTTEGLEKERNFYFDKLRDIEELVQNFQDSGGSDAKSALLPSVFAVLYATNDGNGNGGDMEMENVEEEGVGADASLVTEEEVNQSVENIGGVGVGVGVGGGVGGENGEPVMTALRG